MGCQNRTAHPAAFLGTLAEGLASTGALNQALLTIDEALHRSQRDEEHWCVAELLRIKGELRCVTGVARLWQSAGRNMETHRLLSASYGRFTEGYETSDLTTARALLEALS